MRYYANERCPTQVIAHLRVHAGEGPGVSRVTVAESLFCVAKSGSNRNLAALRQFFKPLEIANSDPDAAEVYGTARSQLESE
jgi:tRNA(fMet)-specific endonuclease VapC